VNLRTAISLAVITVASACVAQTHPVPDSPKWLTYSGASDVDGKDLPGSGKHVVLVSAEQEYRSEQALPMMARMLSTHHGFDCTVLFAQKNGMVDPTQKTRPDDKEMFHDIPGLEHLASADLMILFHRFITLPDEQAAHVMKYLDSGKPIFGIRTANHGFRGDFHYKLDGKRVRFGEDVLGGSFRGHHGGWHREATRGIVVKANKDHPILRGVTDVFGPSDVYRTYGEDKSLPENCTALLLGQPLVGLNPTDEPNTKKEALPIAWTKSWTGNEGKTARVFQVTMGSARDHQSAGYRRLNTNAIYWCLQLEDQIDANSCVDIVGDYKPLKSGFNYPKLGVVPHPPHHYK
jgi:hypothetical protein